MEDMRVFWFITNSVDNCSSISAIKMLFKYEESFKMRTTENSRYVTLVIDSLLPILNLCLHNY